MIYTGKYDNCLAGNFISISGDKGNQVDFSGRSYSKLAPKLEFWKTWHENIGKIPEADNNKYYIEQYYEQVLSKLDTKEVALELGENPILLCYENSNDFCHRHIVAAWLEDELGISVPEVKVDLEGNINALTKPEYIKEQYLNIAHKEKPLIYKNDYLEMEYNNCDQEYIADIIKTIEEEYPKIMNFFGLKTLDKKLKIKLWDSFEDFKKYRISIGFLQGDWVTGIARSVSDINEIHMLSLRESVLAPGHQNNNIQTILKEAVHEFAHICHFQYNSYTFILKWFSEGLAAYLANQFTICDIDCSLEEVLNKYINFKYFYTMVSYLINNYDESYLMELAKNNELLIKDTPRIFEETKKWLNIESTIKDDYLEQTNDNPKYIFHGSRKLIVGDIIPQKSYDSSGNELNEQEAIYGTSLVKGAIPYCIKGKGKYSCTIGYRDDLRMKIFSGVIPEGAYGYLYVFDAKDFIQCEDTNQYVSYKPCQPLAKIKIYYKDFKDCFVYVSNLDEDEEKQIKRIT